MISGAGGRYTTAGAADHRGPGPQTPGRSLQGATAAADPADGHHKSRPTGDKSGIAAGIPWRILPTGTGCRDSLRRATRPTETADSRRADRYTTAGQSRHSGHHEPHSHSPRAAATTDSLHHGRDDSSKAALLLYRHRHPRPRTTLQPRAAACSLQTTRRGRACPDVS